MLNLYIFTCIRIRPLFIHRCRKGYNTMRIKAVSLEEEISFICEDRNKWRTCAKKGNEYTGYRKYGEFI